MSGINQKKVFMSWSGAFSKEVANRFSKLVESTFLVVRSFISENDIPFGDMWIQKLVNELSDSDYAFIFLTSENIESQWIYFEAGAIWNKLGQSKVCPILIDINFSDIARTPLSHLQGFQISEVSLNKLFIDLHSKLELTEIKIENIKCNLQEKYASFEEGYKLILEKFTSTKKRRPNFTNSDIYDAVQLLTSIAISNQNLLYENNGSIIDISAKIDNESDQKVSTNALFNTFLSKKNFFNNFYRESYYKCLDCGTIFSNQYSHNGLMTISNNKSRCPKCDSSNNVIKS